MFMTIALIVAAVIGAVLVFAATKPATFRYQRTARINAPADRIFPFINDFHSWTSWSPYENLDPGMQRTYGAVTSGRGATYGWQGNNKVGQGHMEILESTVPSRILIKLDFLKPMEAHNTAEFTLVPDGGSTVVTWAMFGPQLYMGKVMSIFFNMDKMVGTAFETGLASLKTLAEK